jgi:methyltransferase
MTPAVLLLGAVTAERLAELWLARRNALALLAKGASEFTPGHYPAIVLLHALWLASLWLFGWAYPLSSIWLLIFLALQALRAWVLMTLRGRWTTRIIVLPSIPLVATGPYRFLSHPNYVVVIGEIAALPLCLGLPWVALVFSIANAVILAIRVNAENGALSGLRSREGSEVSFPVSDNLNSITQWRRPWRAF